MIRQMTPVAFFALILFYASSYLFYRVAYHDLVLNYVGGHVMRPKWFPPRNSLEVDFTFNAHSRRFGPAFLGESFAGENIITRLSEATGRDMAEIANTLFYPAARIDHLFTGRYIRFNRFASRPIFSNRTTSPASTEIILEPVVVDWPEFYVLP